MATIEYLNKRLEGKVKEIQKLEKKLERIRKAEATGWEVNPYYYDTNDLKWTLRDLDEAKKALDDLNQKLTEAVEKSESRNIKVIIEFLEGWQKRVTEFYEDQFLKYKIAQEERWKENSAYCDWCNSGESRKVSPEEREKRRIAERKAERDFNSCWSFLFPYIERELNKEKYKYEFVLNREKLAKDLKAEADAKYDDIIERTNKFIGKITDASALSIGAKGELNGYIIGERGTVKVQTIGAGGYNIQCFHFRTLVNLLK